MKSSRSRSQVAGRAGRGFEGRGSVAVAIADASRSRRSRGTRPRPGPRQNKVALYAVRKSSRQGTREEKNGTVRHGAEWVGENGP